MPSYVKTSINIFEYSPRIRYQELPLMIDDNSLAFHLGIRNKTLWWAVMKKNRLYETFEIPKRGKPGMRYLQNPQEKLKNIQKSLLGILSKLSLPAHIGAYVPGRSCVFTAQQHVNKAVIVSMDIKDFFPSVKRSMVRRYFNWVGYPHLVSSLIADLVTYTDFLPQGAPTSGMIANLVADLLFDQAILGDLEELDPRWVYTRYSDDIDISHPDKQSDESIETVIDIVRKRLWYQNFRVNEDKVKVERRGKTQRVLGLAVDTKVSIPPREVKQMKGLIHNCRMHGFASQIGAKADSVGRLVGYIRGKLAYYYSVDPGVADRLNEDFDEALTIFGEEVSRVEVER